MANDPQAVFDYRLLRFIVGAVALSLPVIVSALADVPLPSISASYHEGGRDAFVGMLFVVGALMMAYNGHFTHESIASKTAASAAFFVAVFPTTRDSCGSDYSGTAKVHFAAAILLFSILAYFCFGPFGRRVKNKIVKTLAAQESVSRMRRRRVIYLICGSVIVFSMVGMGLAYLFLDEATRKAWRITYYGEFAGLAAFGVAWIVAGKVLPFLVDPQDRLHIALR